MVDNRTNCGYCSGCEYCSGECCTLDKDSYLECIRNFYGL